MKKLEELINNSLLEYGQDLTKEEINNIPFNTRVHLCYEVIQIYRIESKNTLTVEEISIIMNRLNISRIHVIERRNIIKYAMNPFTCDELFQAFNNPEEQLSNDNINLIQSSIDFAVSDALAQYIFVSNFDGFSCDDVTKALQTAVMKIEKLKELLEERNINYDPEKIDHWINLAKVYNQKKISK